MTEEAERAQRKLRGDLPKAKPGSAAEAMGYEAEAEDEDEDDEETHK